jgi:hypothetical protein
LQCKDSISSNSAYYIVYKFEKNDTVNTDNPANIAAILPRQPYAIQSWLDHKTRKRTVYTYIVTAADRLHNESVPGKPITIFTRGKNGELRLR